jgi:hypothetical protein
VLLMDLFMVFGIETNTTIIFTDDVSFLQVRGVLKNVSGYLTRKRILNWLKAYSMDTDQSYCNIISRDLPVEPRRRDGHCSTA